MSKIKINIQKQNTDVKWIISWENEGKETDALNALNKAKEVRVDTWVDVNILRVALLASSLGISDKTSVTDPIQT